MSYNHAIAYQNKDITSKILGAKFKNKSFSVYGLDIPPITEVLPTNLPAIEANELRLDNLFLLADGSLALVDYESTYTEYDKIKYLSYIIRILSRNTDDNIQVQKIRMIVLYTADIKPSDTQAQLDIGCLKFSIEEAFLSKLDSQKIETTLREKIEQNIALTEEEQMQFIILPLTYPDKQGKQLCIRRCFELAKKISDEQVQTFVLSGMLVFADKIITPKDSEEVKNWIMMTKVGQLFEEEKLAYAQKQVEEAEKSTKLDIAKTMIENGFSTEEILKITKTLTYGEIETLRQK
jgi:hypothetical protein